MFLETLNWIAIDTETTGINPWEHELLELGAVFFDIHSIKKKFQILISPLKKQDPKAKSIHKITDEEIKEKGVDIKVAMQDFLYFLDGSGFPFLFHNASFDISFLHIAFKKAQLELPTNLYYDNFYISKNHFKNRKSHSLMALREEYNLSNDNSHRALQDAQDTAIIFQNSLKDKQIHSQNKYNTFLRYHRRFDDFVLKLPKNFKNIQTYINNLIKNKSLISIEVVDTTNKHLKYGQIIDMMIFNQAIFLKFYELKTDANSFLPLRNILIHDINRGIINYQDILNI